MDDNHDVPNPDEQPEEPGQGGEPQKQPGDDAALPGQQIRHRQLSALVPEQIGRGVFSTGAIVFTGNSEFTLDFLLRMSRPHQVVARVALPHAVFPQVIKALKDNIAKFEDRFGKIPELPKPTAEQQKQQTPIQDVYDDLKIPDEVVSGRYANGVMIGHSASEFVLDFITNFFPRSAVSCRVYMSAPQVPRLLQAMEQTYGQFVKKVQERRQQMQDRPVNPDIWTWPSSPQNPPDDIPPTDSGGSNPKRPDTDPPGSQWT